MTKPSTPRFQVAADLFAYAAETELEVSEPQLTRHAQAVSSESQVGSENAHTTENKLTGRSRRATPTRVAPVPPHWVKDSHLASRHQFVEVARREQEP